MKLSTVGALKHVASASGSLLSKDDLKKLKSVMLEILIDVLNVCDELNIPVTMSGGTCLGTVRHQGYIPWDDDLDINMRRQDVQVFIDAFGDRFGDRYWIHAPGLTDGYELDLLRIRKKGTTVRTHDDTVEGECGAYIEVFILENAPDNALLRSLHGFGSLAIGFLLSCRRYYEHADHYRTLLSSDADAMKAIAVKSAIGRLASFASIGWWLKRWDDWNALCSNNDSAYVTIPAGRAHYFGELHPREVFFPVAHGSFEGLDVPIPADSDRYLTALYGPSYMTPPPARDWETHAYVEFDLPESCVRAMEREDA